MGALLEQDFFRQYTLFVDLAEENRKNDLAPNNYKKRQSNPRGIMADFGL